MSKKIGFGGYRISHRSQAHREALEAAIAVGLELIDTSSNYTDGESETLVGEVLQSLDQDKHPILVTKAGYIQGKNLDVIQQLHLQGKAREELVDLSADLKHSIHPDFLGDQIERSLKRLQVNKIDYFLLHNPEYYFKTEGATQAEYCRRIKKAFSFLEKQVEKGLIGAYGISSNTFPVPAVQKDKTEFDTIIRLAQEVSPQHHFKMIQFPFNLIERGALDKDQTGKTLVQKAKENGIITLANRPLNAFTNDGLVRLADYPEYEVLNNKAAAEKQLKECLQVLDKKIEGHGDDDKVQDIPLIKQFEELWLNLPSPDAVEQVFFGHFFPLVAQIWGERGVPQKESIPFYKLLDYSMAFSRIKMGKAAKQTFKKLVEEKVLDEMPSSPLANAAIKQLFEWDIDYVLVGMKKLHYVNQLKEFI